MVGGILGSRKGLLSVAAYICEGSLGLPVFAEMSAGLPVLLGPTGGYIISFAPAVVVIGYLSERNFTKNYFTFSKTSYNCWASLGSYGMFVGLWNSVYF